MTSETSYPQVFLDANALVKVAYSISHHLRDPQQRKSILRHFMERRVITFSTGLSQFRITINILKKGSAETHSFNLSEKDRNKMLEELLHVTCGPNPMILLVALDDVKHLDACRKSLYEALSEEWARLVNWDEEDRYMIREASVAYAKFGVITTAKGVCRPRPMILVTDDTNVRKVADSLDKAIKAVSQAIPQVKLLPSLSVILHVIGYDELRRLALNLTQPQTS